MKTNHGRGFKARQDFRPSYRFPSQAFKASSSRGTRTAIQRELSKLRQGTDPDSIIFTIPNEVEDKWGWD